jgi:hypothetical protein
MDQQQAEHRNLEPFKTLMEGSWQDLHRLLVASPEMINVVDACKANIIHAAYLYGKYEIGRKLVTMFPTKAVNGYGEHLLASLHYHQDPYKPEESSMYLGRPRI